MVYWCAQCTNKLMIQQKIVRQVLNQIIASQQPSKRK